MKINIITEDKSNGWILRRCADELETIPGVEINSNSPNFDVHYFINYALYTPYSGINIGHFTHLEDSGLYRNFFLDSIDKFDYYTVTCDITKDILVNHGAKKENIYKMSYGSDSRLNKDIVFGIVGRTYPNGRKGEYLVDKMSRKYTTLAWGKGWPCEIYSDKWEDLPEFYKKIDYLVVTALNEGGPVPVIDAIRAGVPVIAPDVGWCWEFPVIRYKKGDWESLNNVLRQLKYAPTWKKWREDHEKMFAEL